MDKLGTLYVLLCELIQPSPQPEPEPEPSPEIQPIYNVQRTVATHLILD